MGKGLSWRNVITAGLQAVVKLGIGSDTALLQLRFIKNKPLTLSALKKGMLKLRSLLLAIGIDVPSMPLPPSKCFSLQD